MKREIKFRGKLLKEEDGTQFVIGWLVKDEQGSCISPFNAPYVHRLEVDEKTTGQFTGLKDKNGKEIYEGDIVKISSKYFRVLRFDVEREEDYICAVWHDDELAQFNIGDIRKNVIPRKDLAKRYYQVIGNIYENPELLKP